MFRQFLIESEIEDLKAEAAKILNNYIRLSKLKSEFQIGKEYSDLLKAEDIEFGEFNDYIIRSHIKDLVFNFVQEDKNGIIELIDFFNFFSILEYRSARFVMKKLMPYAQIIAEHHLKLFYRRISRYLVNYRNFGMQSNLDIINKKLKQFYDKTIKNYDFYLLYNNILFINWFLEQDFKTNYLDDIVYDYESKNRDIDKDLKEIFKFIDSYNYIYWKRKIGSILPELEHNLAEYFETFAYFNKITLQVPKISECITYYFKDIFELLENLSSQAKLAMNSEWDDIGEENRRMSKFLVFIENNLFQLGKCEFYSFAKNLLNRIDQSW